MLLDCTERWIVDALTQLGLGAKIAAGYGNFRVLDHSEEAPDNAEFDNIKNRLAAAHNHATILAGASDEDREYIEFINSVTDWVGMAREVLDKDEVEKQHILRFFRSEKGQAMLNSWPKNPKAKIRIANLETAGL